MPRIHLLARPPRDIDLDPAATPGATLLAAIDAAGLPLGRACGGEGVCRSCAVRVLDGHAHLDPPGELERRAHHRGLPQGQRLACQTQVAAEAPLSALITLWHPSWGIDHPPP